MCIETTEEDGKTRSIQTSTVVQTDRLTGGQSRIKDEITSLERRRDKLDFANVHCQSVCLSVSLALFFYPDQSN